MSRPLAARVVALLAVGGCLSAAAVPALAAGSDSTTVSYVVADGTRQFNVTEVDGTTPLADFTFDSSRAKPFRTVVTDANRLLNSDGYQVSAKMTDLYKREGSGHSYTTYIPSKDLALRYGATPLSGTSTLPVLPKVSLAGTIGTCADSAVASALGMTGPLLTPLGAVTDPVFVLLSPLLKTVCNELGGLSSTARTVDATVDGTVQSVTAALSLSDLPFSLSGGESGRFTNPSFQSAVAATDSRATGAPAATSKRLMTGTPLLRTGDPTALLSTLTTSLTSLLNGQSLVATDNAGVTTVTAAVAAISSTRSQLATTLGRLGLQDQLDLVNTLTKTLVPVSLDALTTVTSQYNAFPVLQASEVAYEAGTYDGTMIVDFFETS